MSRELAFECTPGGTIGRGRRRLNLLLAGLACLMGLFSVLIWIRGAILPGILALMVAGTAGLAWRMSTDLELRRVIVGDDEVEIRLRWGRIRVPREDLAARRLSRTEIEHLERLVSVGFFTVSTGGFDSHLLGEFDLYAADIDRAILLESPPRIHDQGEVVREPVRAVITPDETDRFLALLDSRPPATIPTP